MQRVDMKGPFLLWMLGIAGLLTAIWMRNRFGFMGFVIGLPTGAAVMLGMARQSPPTLNSLLRSPLRTTAHCWPLRLAAVQVHSWTFAPTRPKVRTVTHLLP